MATTPRVTSYGFDQVVGVFGPVLFDGFQEGEGIEIEQVSETFTDHLGTDGKVTRAKTLDRRAKVRINLMQTSAQNAALSAIHIADRDAPNGGGILPLTIRDLNGSSLHFGAEAWISKAPDSVYDRTPTVRTWEITVAYLENFVGSSG